MKGCILFYPLPKKKEEKKILGDGTVMLESINGSMNSALEILDFTKAESLTGIHISKAALRYESSPICLWPAWEHVNRCDNVPSLLLS